MNPRWSTKDVIEECAKMRKNMLEQIVGTVDTELLREQRNHLLNIVNRDETDINELYLDGVINLLDNMLDILDLYTGA